MKKKMYRSISKLRSIPLSIANAYSYFNIYLIKHVYFRYEVLQLNQKQEGELMKISEATMIRKIGLSNQFPQKSLYTKKSQLGVGILKPSAIIAILSLKLYLEHRRNNDKVSNQICMNKEMCNFSMDYVAK